MPLAATTIYGMIVTIIILLNKTIIILFKFLRTRTEIHTLGCFVVQLTSLNLGFQPLQSTESYGVISLVTWVKTKSMELYLLTFPRHLILQDIQHSRKIETLWPWLRCSGWICITFVKREEKLAVGLQK